MAAPVLNRAHQQDIRLKIKTSQLVNRLQDFVLGGKDPKTGDPIEIDPQRMKAIEILLRKSLPDLSTVTLQGDEDGGPIKTEDAGASKLMAFLNGIAERSGTSGDPAE